MQQMSVIGKSKLELGVLPFYSREPHLSAQYYYEQWTGILWTRVVQHLLSGATLGPTRQRGRIYSTALTSFRWSRCPRWRTQRECVWWQTCVDYLLLEPSVSTAHTCMCVCVCVWKTSHSQSRTVQWTVSKMLTSLFNFLNFYPQNYTKLQINGTFERKSSFVFD